VAVDGAPLRTLLHEAAARGGRAAALAGKSVRGEVVPAGSGVQLVFTGPGAAKARAAALSYINGRLPEAATQMREQLVRALEGK
jgi:hypothetical protein